MDTTAKYFNEFLFSIKLLFPHWYEASRIKLTVNPRRNG